MLTISERLIIKRYLKPKRKEGLLKIISLFSSPPIIDGETKAYSNDNSDVITNLIAPPSSDNASISGFNLPKFARVPVTKRIFFIAA